jgi:hypothetical protein
MSGSAPMPSGRDAGGSDDGELKDARAGEGTDRGERGHRKPRSTRLCCLCPQERGPIGLPVAVDPVVSKGGCAPPPLGHFAGPFLPDRDGIASTWVHDSCVMWCPEVYFDQRKQRLKNVTSALKRGSYIKCNHCGLKGATVGCTLPQCPKSYHLACAHAAGSRFNAEAFTVLCPDHGADRKRAPAPLWSKTMNGDPATFLNGDEPRSPHAPVERPKAQTERPGLRRSKRRRLQAKGEVPREEDKDRADMHSQAEKILAAVMAAGQRLRKEEEHVSDDEEAFAKRERRRTVKDKSRIPCVTVGGSFRGGGVDGDDSLPGGWETLAGMEREIKVLKEVALLPLVYPEAFERLGVNPGRGVLLHGPPVRFFLLFELPSFYLREGDWTDFKCFVYRGRVRLRRFARCWAPRPRARGRSRSSTARVPTASASTWARRSGPYVCSSRRLSEGSRV